MQRVHLHNSNSLLQEEREKGREGERERERKVWDNGGLRSAARYPTRDDLCDLDDEEEDNDDDDDDDDALSFSIFSLFFLRCPFSRTREFQATKTANRRIITYKKSSRNSIKRNSTASKKLYRLVSYENFNRYSFEFLRFLFVRSPNCTAPLLSL